MVNEKVFSKALNWVQNKGMDNIRSKFGEFEEPKSFLLKGVDDTFTPDITAIQRTRKRYIEIADKDSQDPKRIASKWKLLNTLANMKGGKFYILAPRGNKAYAQRISERIQASPDIISI